MPPPTVAFCSNSAWNLFNFRRGLLSQLLADRLHVVAIAPHDEYAAKLSALGCQVLDLPMDSTGTSAIADAALFTRLIRTYALVKPRVVFQYTIKPVIYGGLAAKYLNIPYVSTITGLGTAFMGSRWLKMLTEQLYRASQRKVAHVFFQNDDDFALFDRRRLVPPGISSVLPGSGVDLAAFGPAPLPPDSDITFLFMGRILWDKGVGEFINAARRIKQDHPNVRFRLLGFANAENRSAVSSTQIETWVKEGVVEYLGALSDVRPAIAAAHCVVLPTAYREGTPRALLEAAAMGRPLIATDVPGCRHVVEDEINGFLCKPRDHLDLERKMRRVLGCSSSEILAMGLAARAKMEREFDERFVVARYRELALQYAS